MSLNNLDIIIGVVLLIFGIWGLMRGAIAELASLLALWLGIVCARRYSDIIAQWLDATFNMSYSNTIAYAITFIAAFLLMVIVGKLASRLARGIGLGIINRIGGGLLKMFEGLLVCGMIVMVMKTSGLDQLVNENNRRQSVLYGLCETIIPSVSSWAVKGETPNINGLFQKNDGDSNTNQGGNNEEFLTGDVVEL